MNRHMGMLIEATMQGMPVEMSRLQLIPTLLGSKPQIPEGKSPTQ